MKQVAFTDTKGQIMYIITPGGDNDYINGVMYGDYIARDVPANADPTAFMIENYYENGDWVYRGKKPSDFHVWANSSWELDQSLLFTAIRSKRDNLLLLSDWTQLSDVVLSDSKKEEWALYRQALRAVPQNNQNATSMEDVSWPVPPA